MEHEVAIHESATATRFIIWCEACGDVGTADDLDSARVVALLHNALGAMLVEAGEAR